MAYVPCHRPVASLAQSQLEVVGRLDHLVEAVYDRFKDRYFKGECTLLAFYPPAASLTLLLFQS